MVGVGGSERVITYMGIMRERIETVMTVALLVVLHSEIFWLMRFSLENNKI